MDIDKTWGKRQSAGINFALAVQGCSIHCRYLSLRYGYAAETGGRTATVVNRRILDNQVVIHGPRPVFLKTDGCGQ
jgi:hypothetical protein